ncbi:MAG: hypothetical protein NTY64_12045 [Deltaproteobacteria bacterium]|nr:hypothetical protein [Deltaproteobacteria bacterium]
MKGWLKYFLLACSILVLLLGSLLGLVLWALNTPGGTRALLKVTSILSPVTIEAREISGRLRDELRMQGLQIHFSRLTIRADSFYLRWQAPELWNGKILVSELSLKSVQLQDNRPGIKKISFPGWPSAPFWLTRFQGHVETFLVQNLTYERQSEEPVHIDRLSARFLFSPLAKAEGRLDMSFLLPAMDLRLQAVLGQDYGGFNSFSAEAHLQAGQNREEATGAFLISGRKEAIERLHFGGNVGVTPTAVSFWGVRLFQPGRKGLAQGEGKVNFAENPIFELRVNFMDVDLASELKMPTDLSGKVELKGLLNDYRGQFLIANRGPGWLEGRASGTLRGNLGRLEIGNLDAAWLKGSVRGALKISWKEGISIQGKLQGRRLNPAVFGPEWKGGINLDLSGQFSRPKIGNPEASFTVGLLESRLADKVLTGNLAGTLKENLLSIAEMNLHGQGLDLQARGILQERMDLKGQADLARLIPEGRGTLSLAGWLRFREGRLAAALAGRGKDIWLQKVKAGRFDAELELKEYSPIGEPHFPPHFSLGVKAESLEIGTLQAESARFDLSGTPGGHQGQFASRLPNGEIQTVFTGSYKEGKWQGTVQKLTGRDPEALWNLQEQASVILSSKHFRMSPLRMLSNHGEKIQVQADLLLNPAVGSLQARWEAINLARGNFWLKQGRVSGHSGGVLNAQLRKGGIRISGGATLQGGLTHNSLKVEVPAGSVKLEWDEKGLNASADARVSPEGRVKVRLDSPEPFRQDLPQEGRIDLQWKMVDLGLFFPLLPKNLGLKGKGSGNLKGQWFSGRRLEAAGGMKVTRGEISWQGDPTTFSASLDTAALDFIWKDENLQGNVSLASPAQGGLKGDFQLPLSASLSPSFNRRGSLKIRLGGQLKENGILSKLYPEVIQKSQGKVVLSADGSGSWEKPRFTANLQISDAGILWRRQMGSPKATGASGPSPMEIPSGSLTLDWGEEGMQGSLDLGIKKEGKIHGQISSREPARFAQPTQGKIGIAWSGLDLSLLQPFLPQPSRAEGQTEGKINGHWLPGGFLDVAGGLKVAEARLGWEGEKGLITVPVNRGGLDFQWRKENLQGNVSLSIGDYGSLKGSFRLPLPACLSPVFDPAGPIQVVLEGQAQERGLLVALFPGTVQESRGKVDLDLRFDGSWEKPRLKGTLQLAGAGAQLPALGIRVEDVSTRLELENDQLPSKRTPAREWLRERQRYG